MSETLNRGYTEVPSSVVPDVPFRMNTALGEIDADIQGLDVQKTADDAQVLASAKGYADTKDTANRSAWATADAAKLVEAKDYADDKDTANRSAWATADAVLAAKQPVKCVRLESGAWVWDATAGTHFLIPDPSGALIVRATASPVPAATPVLNW